MLVYLYSKYTLMDAWFVKYLLLLQASPYQSRIQAIN